jgi:4-hydroxy-tetrahydrodipicolinate reductase
MNSPLKIAIIGYGKMGKEIEKYALEYNYQVLAIVDNNKDWNKFDSQIRSADVAIEFTTPDVVISNMNRLFDMNVPVVTGTTGWLNRMPEIEQNCSKCNGSLFYASNFSVGVNLFFALNRYLAALMHGYADYRSYLEETHHTQKLDAPSGTAITMINEIIKANPDYKGWKFANENPAQDQIPVESKRIEGVTGIHKIKYESVIDSITIEHKANNREGFARGALMAAKWLPGRKGIFTMSDLLKL